MGIYLNPPADAFYESLNSPVYVDKTGLIEKTNRVIRTGLKYICISRPRRFGKTVAIDMLAAYYGAEKDSSPLFDPLLIGKSGSYKKHLNQYDVIRLNIQELALNGENLPQAIERRIIDELRRAYPHSFTSYGSLAEIMSGIYLRSKRPFVVLIDEWDYLFREIPDDKDAQKTYLNFLRSWLKDKAYVALAYMTGILPVKKYGTHSALNMFTEYTMADPGYFAQYFGFTESEVRSLCNASGIDFEETKLWYDGYNLNEYSMTGDHQYSIYCPKSIIELLEKRSFKTYWNRTETYEALKIYIDLNIDGLREKIIRMLGGESFPVNMEAFSNDLTHCTCCDDVFTLLIHLGYLAYEDKSGRVRIPNKEVMIEYLTAVNRTNWGEVARSVNESKVLLESLWDLDPDAVAAGIERSHDEISVLKYNDENSLSCIISLSFYYAREYYTIVREFPTGKGFADIIYLPRPNHLDKPAVIVELKKDSTAKEALAQIHEKNYPEKFKDYQHNMILAGIAYDSKTKEHSCVIQKYKAGKISW